MRCISKNTITEQTNSQSLHYETAWSPQGVRRQFAERQIQLSPLIKKRGGVGTYTRILPKNRKNFLPHFWCFRLTKTSSPAKSRQGLRKSVGRSGESTFSIARHRKKCLKVGFFRANEISAKRHIHAHINIYFAQNKQNNSTRHQVRCWSHRTHKRPKQT